MPAFVWLVTVEDCDGISSIAVCGDEETAERELLKVRDKLVRELEDMKEPPGKWPTELQDTIKQQNNELDEQIKQLLNSNHQEWEFFPHSTPVMTRVPLLSRQ